MECGATTRMETLNFAAVSSKWDVRNGYRFEVAQLVRSVVFTIICHEIMYTTPYPIPNPVLRYLQYIYSIIPDAANVLEGRACEKTRRANGAFRVISQLGSHFARHKSRELTRNANSSAKAKKQEEKPLSRYFL